MRRAGAKYLRSVLAASKGSIRKAAKMAGINRTDFYKKLERHGVALPRLNRCGNKGSKAWQELRS